MTIATELSTFVESEAYNQLFNDLRIKYLREFENSASFDHDSRQHAYTMLKAARDLRTEIERYVNNIKVNNQYQRT